jgi:hypothetical protein
MVHRDDPRINASTSLLGSYPAFRYLQLKWLPARESLLAWNALIAVLFGVLLMICAAHDHTLWMGGRDTGFFEHPGILIFLLSHAFVPLLAVRAVTVQVDPLAFVPSALSPVFVDTHVALSLERFRHSVARNDNRGRTLYRALLLIGGAAFVWNCFQNQLPYRFVGIDFWDSMKHPWGYWSTRVYKFYLWLFLIPALTHFLILSVWSISSIITAAAREQELELNPYHEDGCGGVKLLVDSLLNPLIPIAIVGAALACSAFLVHEKLDVTTIGGSTLAVVFFSLIYVKPARSLRQAIGRDKQRQIKEIKQKQREYYQQLHESGAALPDGEPAQAILSLSEICKHIANIPDWPQLQRAMRVIALAGSSPALAWSFREGTQLAQKYLFGG